MAVSKRQQEQVERLQRLIEAHRIVSKCVCPDCGTGLIRNLALPGWYQCGGYADKDFRTRGYENAPKCHFQTFYDPTPDEHRQVLKAEGK